MKSRHGYVLAAILCSLLVDTFAITRQQFFGQRSDDTPMLVPNDDDSSTEITLSVPYPFYDKPRTVIYVNNNGALTFSDRAPSYSAVEFPRNQYQLIAQFWGDVDTRETGTVWYMESTNQELLDRATDYVRRGFVTERDFRPTHLFIATWEEVGYYEERRDKNNTFQTILATDSVDLYVIYLYANIDWTTGDSNDGQNGLGGTPAQVGFNAGDWLNSYAVPGSRTDDIVDVDKGSNINMTGVWVFHVSGATVRSGGCSMASDPDLTLTPSYGSMLGGETVSVTGPCFRPSDEVQCEFDSIRSSAIFVSTQEVLCVSPQLTRSGRVTFRLYVNGTRISRTQFTSIPIENAYQVDVQTPTGKVTIASNEEIQLHWSPEAIFPRNSSSDFQVTIAMYRLDMENGEWNTLHVFHSNSANDGEETVTIPDNLDAALEISPVLFRISASINPTSTVRSGTLYTELVRTGQSAARWSSQYFYVNPLVTTQTSYHLCQAWYEAESANAETQPVEEIAPCPPTEAQARGTNSGVEELNFSSFYGKTLYQGQWLDSFHPGASSCFTGYQRSSTSMTSSTQQCCYDNNGDLITGAPGGGAVNKVSMATSRVRHFQENVRPYLLCCTGFAPSCQKYYEHRPSQDGRGYQPPLPAWVFGDPHLVTLDGHEFTFNGKGEFILIKTHNDLFTLQGRMQQYNNVSATVLTAIAGKELYSDRVMIAQGRQGIDAYVNGEIVDLNFVKRQEFRNVTLVLESDSNGVTVIFSSGVVLRARLANGFISTFNVVLPSVYREITQGLLGFYDGNSSNDLQPNNGISPLPISTEDDRVHTLFGLTWILTNSQDSLFTYRPYENFTNLRDPDFTPSYLVDSSSADVSTCNGDPFCEFDVVTTGNAQVGVATLETVGDIQDAVQLSYPVVCDPPCVNGACVANNTCSCSAGYTGFLCNSFMDIRSCDLNPCADGEKCAIVAGSYFCTPNCGQSPLSPLCLVISSGPCEVNHCNNRGVCRPSNASSYGFQCTCPTGYTGRLCDVVSRSCVMIASPCQNGGTCNGESCACREGYSGDYCEIGPASVSMYIIIGASVGGGVVLVLCFILLCIVVMVLCSRKASIKSVAFGAGVNKGGTLTKTPDTAAENATQGTSGSYHGNTGSQTPANPAQPAVPTIHVQQNHYVSDASQSHEGQYEQIRDARTPGQYQEGDPSSQNRNPHDVTPPPPYMSEWQRHNSNQNHNVQSNNAHSDSSSIDGSGIDVQVVSHTDSSRSDTTSPNSDKISLERAESLKKHSLSSQERVFRTPSPGSEIPLASHSHSNSQQNIPIRSTASTPCQGPVGMKRNLTVPRNWLSMSSGHLAPARGQARRHSSSSSYLTSIVSDGSGSLTMVTEV